MTNTFRSTKLWSALAASALMLGSAAAFAQTQPPEPAPPAPMPDTAPPPAPPPAAVAQEGAEQYPKMSAGSIMLGKNTWIRIGLQAQVWADYAQDLSTGGYSNNLFMRRGRILIGAQATKDVNLWFQLDAPRIGQEVNCSNTGMTPVANCNKRFSASDGGGEILQDAWGEVKLAGDAFMVEAGLMVIPFAHEELTSTTTFMTSDVNNTSILVPNTSGTRDTGFQIKGYLEQFEYRLGLFSGSRQGASGTADGDKPAGHNMPRIAAHLQYQFFDVEKGYVYSGNTYGKKKLLGISAGVDFQKNDDVGTTSTDPYLAFSAGVFGAWPLAGEAQKGGGDEVTFLGEFYHYDGGGTAALKPQNDFDVEASYYNHENSFSVFGKFEMLKTSNDTDKGQNRNWIEGGVRYYVVPDSNNMNFTLAYRRVMLPNAADGAPNGTNEFILQAQFFYY